MMTLKEINALLKDWKSYRKRLDKFRVHNAEEKKILRGARYCATMMINQFLHYRYFLVHPEWFGDQQKEVLSKLDYVMKWAEKERKSMDEWIEKVWMIDAKTFN